MTIEKDNISRNNKRIAKNTIFLYIRMLVVMCVTLFTSRVILQALGVVDFGIYNVVGGLSSSFIFFSSALTNSTQRYLNIALGKNNINDVKNIFNLSLLIYSVIAILVILVGTLLGTWLITDKLIIPEEKLWDAYIVFYTTLLSLAITFISSVFESVLIARENMKIYAYLGVFDAIAKLGIAYCIHFTTSHKLIFYAFLMVGIQLAQKLFLAIYCLQHYPECRYSFYWNKSLFKNMFAFTGWNIYGSGVWMVNEQGINILLNMYFGPIVNAARGISVSVNNAVNNFSVNFFTAVRPQIVKNYAAGDYDYLKKLVFASSRYSIYLLWILCFPILLKTEYILSLWLGEVPDYAVTFVRWILVYSLFNSLNNPLWSVVLATGRLKKVVLTGSNVFLLAYPISFMFLKHGFSPEIVYPILIVTRVLFLLIVLIITGKTVNISIAEYCNKVIRPTSISIIPLALIGLELNKYAGQDFISFVLITIISITSSILSIFILGTSRSEKSMTIVKIKSIISKI